MDASRLPREGAPPGNPRFTGGISGFDADCNPEGSQRMRYDSPRARRHSPLPREPIPLPSSPPSALEGLKRGVRVKS